jgi:hypothetical protein
VAMHRVDIAFDGSLPGLLGFANVRHLDQPFPTRDDSSSPSTIRSNFQNMSSLRLVSRTRK